MVALVWVILVSTIILFAIYEVRSRKEAKTLKLIREAVGLNQKIAAWIRDNVKDGCPISILSHQDLLALFKRDQELYNKIIKLDPEWGNVAIPPAEMHKHFIELAQGKYK